MPFLWLGRRRKTLGVVGEGMAVKESLLAMTENQVGLRRAQQGMGLFNIDFLCHRLDRCCSHHSSLVLSAFVV